METNELTEREQWLIDNFNHLIETTGVSKREKEDYLRDLLEEYLLISCPAVKKRYYAVKRNIRDLV